MKDNEVLRRIRETKQILFEFDETDDRYFTILLNSLLSLIVLPTEKLKRRPMEKVFGASFAVFQNVTGIVPKVFNPIKKFDKAKGDFVRGNNTPQWFVNKLRNGIAHQHIEFIDTDADTKIRIFNVFPTEEAKKREIDFDIVLSAPELKSLALFIADCYLRTGQTGAREKSAGPSV